MVKREQKTPSIIYFEALLCAILKSEKIPVNCENNFLALGTAIPITNSSLRTPSSFLSTLVGSVNFNVPNLKLEVQ